MPNPDDARSIRVYNRTYRRLSSLGNSQDTYQDIVAGVLDAAERADVDVDAQEITNPAPESYSLYRNGTAIQVTAATADAIKARGHSGDSYEDALARLLDALDVPHVAHYADLAED